MTSRQPNIHSYLKPSTAKGTAATTATSTTAATTTTTPAATTAEPPLVDPATAPTDANRRAAINAATSATRNVHTVYREKFIGKSTIPVRFSHQVIDEEEGFDRFAEPTAEHKKRLEMADLNDEDHYEDPLVEAGYRKLTETPEERAAATAAINDPSFKSMIASRITATTNVDERVKRKKAAIVTAPEMLALQKKLIDRGTKIHDKLAKTGITPFDKQIEQRFMPPATEKDKDRIVLATAQKLDLQELRMLLDVNCFRGISEEDKQTMLSHACINSIVTCLAPICFVPEVHREHYTVRQLLEVLTGEGCRWHSVSLASSQYTIAEAIDLNFYRSDITVDRKTDAKTLHGGHSHYDTEHRMTKLAVLHFYCCKRPKLSKEQIAARKPVGLAADVLAAEAAVEYFSFEDDLYDDTQAPEEEDETSMHIQFPNKTFCYRLDVVCVEAIDCEHANEAVEEGLVPEKPAAPAPAAPATTADDLDAPFDIPAPTAPQEAVRGAVTTVEDDLVFTTDFGGGFDFAEQKRLKDTVLPDGKGKISSDLAGSRVGKFRAASFLANCMGENPLYGLCIRAFNFSAATE